MAKKTKKVTTPLERLDVAVGRLDEALCAAHEILNGDVANAIADVIEDLTTSDDFSDED